MMAEGIRTAGATVVFVEDGPGGSSRLVTDGFQPVRSRWTWQSRLPELWLRAHAGRLSREVLAGGRKEG